MQRTNPTYKGQLGDEDSEDIDWGTAPTSGPMPGFSLNTLVSGTAGASSAPFMPEAFPSEIHPGSRLFRETGAPGRDPVVDLYHYQNSGALSWPVTQPLTSQEQLLYAKYSGTEAFARSLEEDYKFRMVGFSSSTRTATVAANTGNSPSLATQWVSFLFGRITAVPLSRIKGCQI